MKIIYYFIDFINIGGLNIKFKQLNLKISNILSNIPEYEYLEYIFLDNIKYSKYIVDYTKHNNSYILSLNDNDELYILEENNDDNIIDFHDNVINSRPELDLIIITDESKIPDNYIQEMITQNTIITKIFNNNITYIEDNVSDNKILITESDTYILNGSGVKTSIINNHNEI